MGLFPGWPDALAMITGNGNLRGTVKFFIHNGSVLLMADLRGLPENDSGFFALHIHEGGSCGAEGYAQTGGHYNPGGQPHPKHAGDLPPLLSLKNGRAYLVVETDRFALEDVIGRTVVIHSGPDDFVSQPAGNAGEKIGCGVIRRSG